MSHRRQQASIAQNPNVPAYKYIEYNTGFFYELHSYGVEVQTELQESKDAFLDWQSRNLKPAKRLNPMGSKDEQAKYLKLWTIVREIWNDAWRLERDQKWPERLKDAAASLDPAAKTQTIDMDKPTDASITGKDQAPSQEKDEKDEKKTPEAAIRDIKKNIAKLKEEFESLGPIDESDSENSEPGSNASSGDADAAFQRLENDKAEKRKQIAEGLSTRDRPGRSDNNSSGNAPPTSLTLDQINVSFGKRPNGGRAGVEERHSGR